MLERCSCLGRGTPISRAIRNRRVLVLCISFTAIFALLENIGSAKFRSPASYSYGDVRDHLYYPRKLMEPNRVLEETRADQSTPPEPKSTGQNPDPNSYKALIISMILADEEAEGTADEEPTINNPENSYEVLGRKISNWDRLRAEWLKNNPGRPGTVSGASKPRVMLVTGSSPGPCESPVGDHLLLKSIKNKIDYCRIHGIEVFYSMAILKAEMGGFWTKLPLIKELMVGHPEVEFIW